MKTLEESEYIFHARNSHLTVLQYPRTFGRRTARLVFRYGFNIQKFDYSICQLTKRVKFVATANNKVDE